MTVSNAEDKSRRMRTDEWDEALEAPSDYVLVLLHLFQDTNTCSRFREDSN